MGWWDDFSGASGRRDINRGVADANRLLTDRESTAAGQLTEGFDTARGYIDPYATSGRQYQGVYDDLMGLNGDEARARGQGIITSDPLWSGALAQQSQAAQRALNARGLGGSGTAALAGQRVLLENYNNVLNRYQQGGQQGMAAAGMGADIASRYGSDRAGLTYGVGQQLAGNRINQANAMAASRNTLTNNLLGVAGVAVNAFAPGFGGSAAGNMARKAAGGWNAMWGGAA